MSIVINAVVGSASANSYVTLAEADGIFEVTTNVPLWVGTDEVKSAALIQATRDLDNLFEWIGVRAHDDVQALAWPRVLTNFLGSEKGYREIGFGYQLDTNPCDGVSIPNVIKEAQCKLAYVLLAGGYTVAQSNIDEVKVGPILVKFSHSVRESGFPKDIIQQLVRIGRYINLSTSAVKNIGMIRV